MYSKIKLLLMLPAFLGMQVAIAQHRSADSVATTDTLKIRHIKDVFTHGEVEGHLRNYFMATRNKDELSDHYANAIGARLGYHTAHYHGFRFGFAGLFTYNTFSSELARPDAISGKLPRYELELFDLEEPENKADLDRLDELYLEYDSKHVKATIGRFSFMSPLINPQDGRMKPYSVQGASIEVPVQKKGLVTLAWFDHFSPRSTVSWFDASEGIGIYPAGVDETGNPSGYRHHVQTKGVAVAGLQLQSVKQMSVEGWNYWIENVSNTTYGRSVLEVKPTVKFGLEGLYQTQAGNGGNPEAALAYFPDQEQWLAGGMVAYEPQHWHFSANYLHLGDEGRFLFPREFGREQFFATVPRGRLEGLGKADALTLKVRRQWQQQFSAEAAITKTWMPGTTNYAFNKYGSEAYWNGLLDLNYKPDFEPLHGFSFRLLYLVRISPDAELPLDKMFYNTNFQHFNFVSQLTF